MKRLRSKFPAAVATALLAATVAPVDSHAAVLVSVTRNESLTVVSGDTDPIPAGWEELTFRISGLTGIDTASGTGLNSITGTFSVSGSGSPVFSVPGNAAQYPGRTTNGDFDERESTPESFVNFPSTVGTFARSPDTANTTSLNGGWFTTVAAERLTPTDDPADGFDNQLLARVYVTPGAHINFSGFYNSANASGPVSVNQALTFSSVPEPTSAGLLALTVAGWSAWRRRRVQS